MYVKAKVLVLLLCVTGVCVYLRENVPQFSQLQGTSPCACEKCISEHEPWFIQRYNKSVEPFLSAHSILSQDNFNWWKRLQAERRSFSVYNKIVNRLFQLVSRTPEITEPSRDRCRTCAVVGNSANLKRSSYGNLIDSHDYIIRMNFGPTKGYEADVGTRTTHHVMYPESARNLDNSTHLVLFPFKILDLEWLTLALTTGYFGVSYAPVKSRIKANKDLVMVLNPGFMRYVHDRWLGSKGSYPSTGFMALVLSLHICDEVNVFGYGADNDGNWSHYWETLKNKNLKTGRHAGTQEYGIIQKLNQQKILKFFTGR